MKLSGIYIFTWWPLFAFCGADVVHMWYYTMTSVVTVGKLAQSFVSVATRNNVAKRQLDREPREYILLCGLKMTDLQRVYSVGRAFYSSLCKSPLSFSGGLIRNVIGFPLHKVIAVIKNESSITSFYDTINACNYFLNSFSLYGKPLWVPVVQR